MNQQKFVNGTAGVTLAANLTSGGLTATLAAGKGALFPVLANGDYYLITLASAANPETGYEVVRSSGAVGDVLTLTQRGVEGTNQAWTTGSKAEIRNTSEAIQRIQNRVPMSLINELHRAVPGYRRGRMAVTALSTFLDVVSCPVDYDAFKLVYDNIDIDRSPFIQAVSAAGLADPGTTATDVKLNNASGTWLAGTKRQRTSFNLATADVGGGGWRPRRTETDIFYQKSVARTDIVGAPRLLTVMTAVQGVATASTSGTPTTKQLSDSLSVRGNGTTDDFTNWVTKADGNIFATRFQAGNTAGPGLQGNFTSTTNISQTPLVAVVFYVRGKVANIWRTGDSIDSHQGTFKGEGMSAPAIAEIQKLLGITINAQDGAWAGQAMNGAFGFCRRFMQDKRDRMVKFNILEMPIGSPNDATGAWNQTISDNIRVDCEQMISEGLQDGGIVILRAITPCSTAFRAGWGATDQFRRDLNDYFRALASYTPNLYFVSADTIMGGTLDGNGQTIPSLADAADGGHPTDACRDRIALQGYLPIYKQIFGV